MATTTVEVGGYQLRQTVTVIESVDLLDLHDTPVEVVAAPTVVGSPEAVADDKAILVLGVSVQLIFGTVAYVADNVAIIYGADVSGPTVADVPDVLTAIENKFATVTPAPVLAADTADVLGKPLMVWCDITPTLGDGSLVVNIVYAIADVDPAVFVLEG